MKIKSLLIVEDDLDLRRSFYDLLSTINIKIYEAGNGIEALEIFKKEDIDFILSDIDMPIMNGLELLKKIREIDLSINFFIMSGNISYNEQDILEKGANHFFQKPFEDFNYLFSLLI